MTPRPDETAHTRAAIAEAAALAERHGHHKLVRDLARALEDVKRLEELHGALAAANNRLAARINALNA